MSKKDKHLYNATIEDVASHADGTAYGNVLNWQYVLNLKVDDSTWKIKFDDWVSPSVCFLNTT